MRKLCILILFLAGCRSEQAAPPASVLNIAYRSTVNTLDPIAENTVISDSIYSNIYEPLVLRDENLKIVPALAVDWSNPDDLTWEFKLRRGVRFHNGAEMRAEDVRHSIERAQRDPGSQIAGSLSTVDRVDVVDAETVRIHTRRPYSILASRLVDIWILPRDYTADREKTPAGTGPYKVESWKPAEFVHLRANPEYWGEPPSVPEVRFKAVPDMRTRVRGLLNGEIHILPLLEPAALSGISMGNSHKVSVQTSSSLATLFLGMDVWREKTPHSDAVSNPFRDLRVRQALYHAINVDHIVGSVLMNYATPATQLVAPRVFGFNEALRRLPYDPQKAKDLLKQAGYPGGFSVRLDFTNNRYRSDTEIGAAVAKDLAEVGIRVSLNPMPVQDLATLMESRDTSLFMFGFTLPSTDASGAFDFLIHTRDAARGYGVNNAGGYSNPELDRLIEQSAEIMKPSDRAIALKQAMELTMSDLPMIPLHAESSISAHAANVKWTGRPDEFLYCKTIRIVPPLPANRP